MAAGDTATHAAEAIGLRRQYLYEVRDADQEFRRAWEEAYAQGTEAIDQEIKRRGVDGWLEPVFQGGQEIGVVRKHSDVLLIFLAKARQPEKYRENVAVKHEGRVKHEHSGRIDLRQATDAELAVLERLAARSGTVAALN